MKSVVSVTNHRWTFDLAGLLWTDQRNDSRTKIDVEYREGVQVFSSSNFSWVKAAEWGQELSWKRIKALRNKSSRLRRYANLIGLSTLQYYSAFIVRRSCKITIYNNLRQLRAVTWLLLVRALPSFSTPCSLVWNLKLAERRKSTWPS